MARNIYQQKLNTIHTDNFSKSGKPQPLKMGGQTVRHSEQNPFKAKSGSFVHRQAKRGRTVENILPEIETARQVPESPEVRKSKTSLLLQDLKPLNRRFKQAMATQDSNGEDVPTPTLTSVQVSQLRLGSSDSQD